MKKLKISPEIIGAGTPLRKTQVNYGGARNRTMTRYIQRPPCKVECTNSCNVGYTGLIIPSTVASYIVVDTNLLINYHEVLEAVENVGIIVSISSLIYIQMNNRKLYFKLKKVFQDPARSVILFQNEYHEDCGLVQREEEDIIDFITRENYATAHFYFQHFSEHRPVILMTDNTSVALTQWRDTMRRVGVDEMKGVQILTVNEYLSEYHGKNVAAKDLFDSLEAAFEAIRIAATDKTDHTQNVSSETEDYYPDDVLAVSLKSGDFVKGILRVNKFRSREEAEVVISEGNSSKQLMGSKGKVLILGSVNMNRSIDGDSVIIKIFPESQWVCKKQEISGSETSAEPTMPISDEVVELTQLKYATGRVVGIHKRNWRDYVCCYDPSEINTGKYVLVTPFDRRVPRIRIGISSMDKIVAHRFVVRIDGWPLGSRYPNGHFVEVIGPVGSLETETRTLLIEFSLYNRPFTGAQLAELPVNTTECPWKMDPAEVARRRDLRNMLIFSIDPIGCQDVDDTLSIRRLDNGNVELGVHIADVTHFVPCGSLLDLEARRRSTSIYMADRRFDMLPHVLSGDLCSLWSDVDRYAVSVIWELTDGLDVVSVDYFRSVIRSRYKLDYEMAQDIYDGNVDAAEAIEKISELHKRHNSDGNGKELFDELKLAISMLANVAAALKNRRMAGGGLELEGMEVQVRFSDPNRTQLEDLHPKEPLEMHDTIAECMIFANEWVARRCLNSYPSLACLRRHPPPRLDHFGELMQCAAVRGYSISVSSNKDLARSLDEAVDTRDPEYNKILRSLATMAMSNAEYISSGMMPFDEYYHYGLALTTYTHFTSPIRRYADILVHRILLCAIEGEPEETLLTNSQLADQCDVMNKQHRQAQYVQRASIELFQALFFRSKPPSDPARYTEAIIVQLRSNGFIVHIPRYGIKGSVFVRRQDGTIAWATNATKQMLDGREGVGAINWLGNDIDVETDRQFGQSIGELRVMLTAESGGRQTYRLFDRVLVRIDVSESNAHGMSLQLELVGRMEKDTSTTSEAISNRDIFQSVRKLDDESLELRKQSEEFVVDPIEAIRGLHSNASLSHLFREFKQKRLNIVCF